MYPSESSIQIELIPLLELVRRIDLGSLRVPLFQRDFIWNEKKIPELFSSIYEGFPIGSILLWTTSNQEYKAKLGKGTTFPNKQVLYPTTFVIDGVQRLSSVYGGLHDALADFFPKKPHLVFDLARQGFGGAKEITPRYFQLTNKAGIKPHYFQVSGLLSRDRFVDAQERLFDEGDRELVKVLLDLSERFAAYKIPVVEIADRDIKEVVDIFLKLNRNVQKLAGDELDAAQKWLMKHS